MESFLALLQRNVLDRQRWMTREELRPAIITWIESCSSLELFRLACRLMSSMSWAVFRC
ncbi:hypothetical protein JOD57_004056 [Geodermatophilus bullaregiensis]|nr:hypothetical protein [Geodermatophilus bullaregiensis]